MQTFQDDGFIHGAMMDSVVNSQQGDGIRSGCEVTAQSPATMTLDVASGVRGHQGSPVSVSAQTVTIGAADASNDRYDIVELDNAGNAIVKAGTASAEPTAPDLTSTRSLLAVVKVLAGATEIENSEISDGRLILGSQIVNNLRVEGQVKGTLSVEGVDTAGSIAFINASGQFAQDNNNIFWDNTEKRQGLGTNTPERQLHLLGTDSNETDAAIQIEKIQGGDSGSRIEWRKARGTPGSQAVVQNGDVLGRLIAWGHDGLNYEIAAAINIEVDGTPGSNDMPGRIDFYTTPDGSQIELLRLRIGNEGSIQGLSTTGTFILNSLTTTQRDALTATDGMILYNTTTDKFQGRAGGVWVDLH